MRVLKAIMSERFSRLPEPSDAWKPKYGEIIPEILAAPLRQQVATAELTFV